MLSRSHRLPEPKGIYWLFLALLGVLGCETPPDPEVQRQFAFQISRGDTAGVRRYLDQGASVKHPLVGALGSMPLTYAVGAGSLDVVRMLIDEGADPDALRPADPERDEAFYQQAESALGVQLARESICPTPLMWAASRGHEDIVSFLLDSGASPDLAVGDWSPVRCADVGGDEGIVALIQAALDEAG